MVSVLLQDAKSLNLDGLLDNVVMRSVEQIEFEFSKRFAKLFPQPIKNGIWPFRSLEYPVISEEQIKQILVENKLVREESSIDTAFKEVIQKHYRLESYGNLYEFVKVRDNQGNKGYRFELHSYAAAAIL